MKEFKMLTEFFGAETVSELKDSIKDIILDRVKQDLEDYDMYLICPDDLVEFIEECKREAFGRIKEEMVSKFETHLRNSIK
jgi:hypothetical protein